MATAMAHGAAMEAAMAQREEVVPVPPPPAAPPPPAGAVATARPAPVASAPPSEFATVLSLQVPVAHSNGHGMMAGKIQKSHLLYSNYAYIYYILTIVEVRERFHCQISSVQIEMEEQVYLHARGRHFTQQGS